MICVLADMYQNSLNQTGCGIRFGLRGFSIRFTSAKMPFVVAVFFVHRAIVVLAATADELRADGIQAP